MTDGDELPLALRAAYLTLHRLSEARFAEFGVTADQFVLLATLADGKAVTQRDLSRRMPSDPSTVRAMLVLLERRGLVQRQTSLEDARSRTVSLTADGRRTYLAAWKAGASIRARMVNAVPAAQARRLVRFLQQITTALQTDSLPVGRTPSRP